MKIQVFHYSLRWFSSIIMLLSYFVVLENKLDFKMKTENYSFLCFAAIRGTSYESNKVLPFKKTSQLETQWKSLIPWPLKTSNTTCTVHTTFSDGPLSPTMHHTVDLFFSSPLIIQTTIMPYFQSRTAQCCNAKYEIFKILGNKKTYDHEEDQQRRKPTEGEHNRVLGDQ